jgi:glyoxylase-like metal-dependent hydrolase (beta-lactamase superfamily II)/8-oxo-dGTP pyrophosphatase MutT (NUDIX family)
MPQVEPRPASTLVLMRDSAEGLQVLLTVRAAHLRFMGGASVFPGGAVAEADRNAAWERLSDIDIQRARSALGDPDDPAPLAWYVCALREAFEEVGFPIFDEVVDRSIADDAQLFFDLCNERGLTLPTEMLVPAGRWVTPLGSPVRFDTRFFLAVAPPGYEPDPDPNEVESADWITASDALTAIASGARLMAPPTVEMLQRLDRYGSCAEAIEGFTRTELRGAGNVLAMRVSPLVYVVLAPNAGVMTGPGTNTYIVGSGPFLLIDPATDDDEYLDAVGRETQWDIDQVLITHRHSDHVGGAAEVARRTGAPVRAFGGAEAGDAVVVPIAADEVIEVPGVALRALHTPGHASDHLCFYMTGAASLFAGDVILGEGTAVIAPPDGDMGDYLDTLHRLRDLHIDRIYPGHWKPLDGGQAVIDGYISHRKEREAKIEAAVGEHPATIDEIVERAYADTPVHLHPVARYSALAHLELLERVGRLVRVDHRWVRRT